jgi:hypothetical protein
MKHWLAKTILTLILFTGVILALPALGQSIGFEGAEGESTLDIIADTANYNIKIKDANLIETTVGQVIAIFLGLLGLLFLSLIIYSGFQWMNAGGNEEQVEEAKKRIINSALGFALIFFAFIISNFVFNFLYKQTGRQTDSAPVQSECQENSDCQENIDGTVCLASKTCGCQSVNDCPIPGALECQTRCFYGD